MCGVSGTCSHLPFSFSLFFLGPAQYDKKTVIKFSLFFPHPLHPTQPPYSLPNYPVSPPPPVYYPLFTGITSLVARNCLSALAVGRSIVPPSGASLPPFFCAVTSAQRPTWKLLRMCNQEAPLLLRVSANLDFCVIRTDLIPPPPCRPPMALRPPPSLAPVTPCFTGPPSSWSGARVRSLPIQNVPPLFSFPSFSPCSPFCTGGLLT